MKTPSNVPADILSADNFSPLTSVYRGDSQLLPVGKSPVRSVSRVGALLGLLLLSGGLGSSVEAASATKSPPVPTDLAVVKSLKKSWEGVSCTGELTVSAGGSAMLAAPLAIAYAKDTLSWVAFITPPTPCAGTVVLGGVKLGLGQQPNLMMGTPPGLVIGDAPVALKWKKIEQKPKDGAPVNVGSLCSGNGGGGSDDMFGGFAGGLADRPDSRTWDTENPSLLKLDGKMKGKEKFEQGRYTVWLDKSKGYLPVRNERWPDQGAKTITTWQPKEVTPGHWLPVRWETVTPGKPTLIGEFKNLRCDAPIPPTWFSQATYPDIASQKPVIAQIQGK